MAVALCVVASLGHASSSVDGQVLDDRGKPVVTAVPPQRIVSLLPSLTETVCALHACERLVGVDRFSSWPENVVGQLTQVGGGLDPNVEAIVALKPDVVLLSNSARLAQRLERLGLNTVVLEPKTQADVLRAMHVIAALLHLPAQQGADALWLRIQQGIAQAAQTVPDTAKGAAVYFEVSRGPYVAGPHSFLGELITSLGMRNVVPAQLGPFPLLSPEFLLRAQPDIVLLGSHSQHAADSYPGWSSLRAVREGRICAFNEPESAILVRPGPRMDEAARILARCLRGANMGRSTREH